MEKPMLFILKTKKILATSRHGPTKKVPIRDPKGSVVTTFYKTCKVSTSENYYRPLQHTDYDAQMERYWF